MVENILVIAILTIAPAIYLLHRFYKADKLKPEPKKLVIRVFFMGTLSLILPIIAGLVFGNFERNFFEINPWLGIFVMSFISAALIEEVSKFLIFKIIIYNNKKFDEVMDGILYMATISLAFAAVENFLYGMGGNLWVIGMRAITAVPLHAICGGIMGYYIGREKISGEYGAAGKGLFLAIFIHGIYDFFAFIPYAVSEDNPISFLSFGVFVVVIVCGLYLMGLIKKARSEDEKMGRTIPDLDDI